MKKRIVKINATTTKTFCYDPETDEFYSVLHRIENGVRKYAGLVIDNWEPEFREKGVEGDYLVICRVYDPECEESVPTVAYSDISETCAKSIARHNNKNKNNSGIWYSCSEDGFVDKHIPGCYR